jgi:hypothetical protein
MTTQNFQNFWKDFLWAIMGQVFGQTGNFWCKSLGQGSCNNLWNAKLFLVVSKQDGKKGPRGIQGIDIAMWLMGVWHEGADHNQTVLKHWQSLTERVSLQDIHNCIDFKQMYYDVNTHWAALAVGFARASNEH